MGAGWKRSRPLAHYRESTIKRVPSTSWLHNVEGAEGTGGVIVDLRPPEGGICEQNLQLARSAAVILACLQALGPIAVFIKVEGTSADIRPARRMLRSARAAQLEDVYSDCNAVQEDHDCFVKVVAMHRRCPRLSSPVLSAGLRFRPRQTRFRSASGSAFLNRETATQGEAVGDGRYPEFISLKSDTSLEENV